jgi:hypothetical protein
MPVQLPVDWLVALGLLVAAGALVSGPFPGLGVSGVAGGGEGGVDGAGGAVAGGGISGSVDVDGALLLATLGGAGAAGGLSLEPDWLSVP